MLETKLDSIIDALREQNTLAKVQEDTSEVQRREDETEKEYDLSETERIIKPDEKKDETIQLSLLDDIKKSQEKRDEQLSLPLVGGDEGFEKGGIVSGPDSGYFAKLHGDEMIIPLDNNYTQGEPSAIDGRIARRPKGIQSFEKGTENIENVQTPMNMGVNIFNKAASVEGELPDIKKDVEKLSEAMLFPIRSTGILISHLTQDALGEMGSIAGDVGQQISQVAKAFGSKFDVPISISNSLVRQKEADKKTEERQKETKEFKTKSTKTKDWWDPFGVFTGEGGGGKRYGTGGSSTTYNRMSGGSGGPGTTYNRGTGGGLPGTGRVLKPLTTRNSAGGYETRLETQLHFLGIPVPFTKGRYRGDSGNARYGSLWPLKDADSRSGVERFNQNPDRPYNLVPSYEGSDMVRPEAIPERSVRTAPSQSSPTNRYGETESSDPLTNMVRGLRDAYIPESRIKAIEEAQGKPLGNTTYGEFQRQLMDQYGSSTRGEQMRQMRERGLLGPQSSAPTGRMNDNIAMLDYSSRQQAMSRINKQTTQPDPIIINNQTTAEDSSSDVPQSHIANMGDTGFSTLYPSLV